ncbi:MAG: tRNA lysidine(34) synthetase TilS [Eubacteriales bacterium]|nr:tRNA lysidine(34) synthetase TilS [Eubacteriales bacterium]
MYEKVRAYIKENQMILPGNRILAGVSGGGDSMAMLSMLLGLSGELGFSLEAVHVHHGIRGEEADRDLSVVEKFCRDFDIPCRVHRFDVPGLAGEWKLGLEETGRIVRRQAFAEEQERSGSVGVRIALAHNKNDLAETMLHNLARGSGLRGLTGIKAVNGNVIRPVLCLERREIDHYLKEKDIPYVTDSSNLEDDYTRNRIRHHILPLMETEVNAKAVEHMAWASEMIAQADGFLAGCGAALLAEFRQADGSFLLTDEFFGKEPVLQSYAVMEALECLAGKRRDISAVHVQQILELHRKQTGRRITLPYGICAGRDYGGIRLALQKKEQEAAGEQKERMLSVPGKLDCSLGSFTAEIFPYFGQKISEKKYTKWMDYDKINRNLSVRTRKPGDYLVISGDGRRKKISRCMIDDKISREMRERIPLLICGEEVLWMVGGRMSERCKITPNTKWVLEVKYQGGNQDE